MVQKLKGVIFGYEDVIINQSNNNAVIKEIDKLMRFLQLKGITPVVLANHAKDINNQSAEEYFRPFWGKLQWFIGKPDRSDWKPKAIAIEQVLDSMKWQRHEVAYLGNSSNDMMTAKNGRVMFINGTWYGKNTPYGLIFDKPRSVARFIDTFCLRERGWHWQIENRNLKVYALGPYGWIEPQYKQYSENAKKALKNGGSDYTNFWIKYLTSSIYVSGLHTEVNYITCYPNSKAGMGNPVIQPYLEPLAKALGLNYVPDLLVRHTTVQPSHIFGSVRTFEKQLNSISLNPEPTKSNGTPYSSPPNLEGKTILVVDDICTTGSSFEAGRAYIESAGGTAICVACLKSMKDYLAIKNNPVTKPYNKSVYSVTSSQAYKFASHIVDNDTPKELDERLKSYNSWDWPVSI